MYKRATGENKRRVGGPARGRVGLGGDATKSRPSEELPVKITFEQGSKGSEEVAMLIPRRKPSWSAMRTSTDGGSELAVCWRHPGRASRLGSLESDDR